MVNLKICLALIIAVTLNQRLISAAKDDFEQLKKIVQEQITKRNLDELNRLRAQCSDFEIRKIIDYGITFINTEKDIQDKLTLLRSSENAGVSSEQPKKEYVENAASRTEFKVPQSRPRTTESSTVETNKDSKDSSETKEDRSEQSTKKSLNRKLLRATKANNIDKIMDALNNGADVNGLHKDWTALSYASFKGYLNIVELLLSHSKIDVNKLNKFHDTALHFAALGNHKKIAALLLAAGAEINSLNINNHTPTKVAFDNRSQGMATLIYLHLRGGIL